MAAGHGCMHKNIFKYIDGDGIFSARWGWDVAWQQQAAVSKRESDAAAAASSSERLGASHSVCEDDYYQK